MVNDEDRRLIPMRATIGCYVGACLVVLTGCGNSTASGGSASGGGGLDLPLPDFDSAAVSEVKNGTIKACPTATLGEMADAFFPDAQWSDFTSTSGKTVVELSGSLTYDNMPADALIQFVVDPVTGFKAEYMEINGQPGNLILMSGLLSKMCEAT